MRDRLRIHRHHHHHHLHLHQRRRRLMLHLQMVSFVYITIWFHRCIEKILNKKKDFTTPSISTTTFTTLVGAPTLTAGQEIIQVSVLNMSWSQNWVQGASFCDPSITCQSTSTAGSSFTYIFQYCKFLAIFPTSHMRFIWFF